MSRWPRILLLLLIVSGVALMLHFRGQLNTTELEHWVAAFGAAGSLVFMLIYALGTVLFFPGSLLTLAGGAIYGPVWGTFYNLTGATLGATLAFLIARYLAADWVEARSSGKLGQLKKGVEEEGWRFVVFVRLLPWFPFNILNYALGLTRVSLSHYIVASYISMFPGALAYTYLGYAGREAVAGGEGMIQKAMLALGLLALVAFLPRFLGRLRRKAMLDPAELLEQLRQSTPPLVLDVRDPEEFSGELGHIDGAINIPLSELKHRLHELNDAVERPIAIVCRTDVRSARAARILGQEGFAQVHVLRMGMSDWNRHGYPVVH